MMDNSYPMRHHVLPVFSRPAGARPARSGRVVACLACAVLAVSAGCRSTGGAEPSPSPTPLDGEVSVCGLATVDQIQQTTGRQIPSFAINNNPDPPDHVSLWCAIGVAGSNDTGRFDLRVTTTYPRNIDSVPTGSTFEGCGRRSEGRAGHPRLGAGAGGGHPRQPQPCHSRMVLPRHRYRRHPPQSLSVRRQPRLFHAGRRGPGGPVHLDRAGRPPGRRRASAALEHVPHRPRPHTVMDNSYPMRHRVLPVFSRPVRGRRGAGVWCQGR